MSKASNLLEGKAVAGPNQLLAELHRVVLETKEIVVASADACEVGGFTRIGLSDAGRCRWQSPNLQS